MPTLILIVGLFLALSQPADAAAVRWELHDLVFDDGGSASGWFIVETDTASETWDYYVTAVDIQSTGGNVLANARYMDPNVARSFIGKSPDNRISGIEFYVDSEASDPVRILSMGIASPHLSSVGGTVPVGSNTEEVSFIHNVRTQRTKIVGSGYLIGTVVPLPSTVLLMATGIAALVGAASRHRQAA